MITVSHFLIITVVTILNFSVCNVSSLFADQVGKFDWKQEYIGKIVHASFENSISINKHVFVTTDKHVVACLNMKNGAIIWRKFLGESDGKILEIAHMQDGVAVVTDSGIARIWEPTSGILKWEVDLSDGKQTGDEYQIYDTGFLIQHYTQGNLLVAISSTGVHTVKTSPSTSNTVVNTIAFSDQNLLPEISHQIFVDSAASQLIHMKFTIPSKLAITLLDIKNTDEPVSDVNVDVPWLGGLYMAVILETKKLVYTGPGTSSFYIMDIHTGQEVAAVGYAQVGISSPVQSLHVNNEKDITSHGTTFVVRHGINEVSLLSVDEENAVTVKSLWTRTFQSTVVDVSIRKVGTERHLFVTTQQKRVMAILVVDMKTGSESPLSITHKLGQADVERVYINMFLKRTTPVGFRALLGCSDDSISLVVHPNRQVWRREESLASVVDALMLDLPLSDVDAGIEAEFDHPMSSPLDVFVKRLHHQISQLSLWFKQKWKDLNTRPFFQSNSKDPLIQVEGLTRDPFSLHKMIVVATRSGTIAGIDSLNGNVVWSHFHPGLKGRNIRLFIQRATAHFPHPPRTLLVALHSSLLPILLQFNPIVGSVFDLSSHFSDMKSPVVQVTLLPTTQDDHLRPLILLAQDMSIRLHPDNPATLDVLKRVELYMYDADPATGHVRGFSICSDDGSKARHVWSLHVPTTHRIVATAGKYQVEKVDSLGRPLANRSVIFKYLNPNAAAIVSESLDRNADRASLLVHIFDAVTGKIIHSMVHKRACGPVHIVHSENWIMYTYWNTKGRRTEIMSLEMYEGERQFNDTVFSSFQPRPIPLILQQAYIFPSCVSCLSISRTERAITARQILFGLKHGAVFGLFRRFFDPRRPLHPADSHREEGLIPYMPEIPVASELLLSYNQTIEGIDTIYTAPAALESTSLVFATGLDLFFTRTQPSKMFDVLKDDFDHFFIGTVLTIMLACAFGTRRLAQIKQLNKAWR